MSKAFSDASEEGEEEYEYEEEQEGEYEGEEEYEYEEEQEQEQEEGQGQGQEAIDEESSVNETLERKVTLEQEMQPQEQEQLIDPASIDSTPLIEDQKTLKIQNPTSDNRSSLLPPLSNLGSNQSSIRKTELRNSGQNNSNASLDEIELAIPPKKNPGPKRTSTQGAQTQTQTNNQKTPQQKYLDTLSQTELQRYNFLVQKNLNMRTELLKVSSNLDMIEQSEKGRRLEELYSLYNQDDRLEELRQDISVQKRHIRAYTNHLSVRRQEIKELQKFSKLDEQENELSYLKLQISKLEQEKKLMSKIIDNQDKAIVQHDKEETFTNTKTQYTVELQSLKEEMKELKEEYRSKMKESDFNHKRLVNLRRDIGRVKGFNQKMKIRTKKQLFEEFDPIAQKSFVLPEDISRLAQEVKDLEAERDHLLAIQDIDKRKNDDDLKEIRMEKERLRQQGEKNDLTLRRTLIEIKDFERRARNMISSMKKKQREASTGKVGYYAGKEREGNPGIAMEVSK